MRTRTLLAAFALTAGLFAASASPAASAPAGQADACSLAVTDLYYATGMNNANATLSGGCTGDVGVMLQRADSLSGPFQDEPDAVYYVQQYSDGTGARGWFLDPAERGYCRAKATFGSLTAYSPNATGC